MDRSVKRVAIIGGGIMGCAVAYYLRRLGVSVTVFERGEIGTEQSSRALGYVRCQGRHRAELPLSVLANRMWETLSAELDADVEYVRQGNLVVAETPADEERLRKSCEAARANGLSTRAVDRDEIARISPKLRGPWRSGIFTEEDGHASPTKATQAFAAAARRLGADVRTNTGVRGIAVSGGRAAGIWTVDGVFAADAVVCVAGVSTNFFLRPLGAALPIQVVRSSNLETVVKEPFTRTGVWTPYISMRPRLDGSFAFGTGYRGSPPDHDLGAATVGSLGHFLPRYLRNPRRPRLRLNRDFADSIQRYFSMAASSAPMPDPVINRPQIEERLVWAQKFFPHLAPLEAARSWACRIDVTPDLVPAIGPWGPPGLFTAVGFCAHGLALAPIVGKTLAEMIATGRSDVDLHPLRPGRFRENDLQEDPVAL